MCTTRYVQLGYRDVGASPQSRIGLLKSKFPSDRVFQVSIKLKKCLNVSITESSSYQLLIDMYFLAKGALIIGFADKRPLIQRALCWPIPLSRGRCSAIGDSTAAPPG